MEKLLNITKRIAGTLMLPVLMYIVMYFLTHANGKMYFGTMEMWKTLILNIGVSVTCAMGIGLQFKSGRFDFSGGAIMLVSGIIASNFAIKQENNIVIFIVLTIVIAVILSILVSLLYVFGRIPIVITTIGMALLYEALTAILYRGTGINIVANIDLKIFSTYPTILIPLILSIAIYAAYSYITVTGKQAALLARNQQSATNIGIKEKKNVIISYVYSGLIFGLATLIYSGTGLHRASFTSLTTVGELFTNILPVFIGLMLIGFCGDTIGIIMGSITLSILSYGLKAVFQEELGTAISIIITAIFILVINVVSAKGSHWIRSLKGMLKKKKISA